MFTRNLPHVEINKTYIVDCEKGLKRFDANGDGSVTTQEIKNFTGSLFHSDKLDTKVFDKLETIAEDGIVSADEYAYWVNSNEYSEGLNSLESKMKMRALGSLGMQGDYGAVCKQYNYALEFRTNPIGEQKNGVKTFLEQAENKKSQGLIQRVLEFLGELFG